MPARVELVHDDPRKTEALVTRLGSEGHEGRASLMRWRRTMHRLKPEAWSC
jgi:hypothetical protein